MATVVRKASCLIFLLFALAMVPTTPLTALSPCDQTFLVCDLQPTGEDTFSFDCQPVIDCQEVEECFFYLCPQADPGDISCEENSGIFNGPAGNGVWCNT